MNNTTFDSEKNYIKSITMAYMAMTSVFNYDLNTILRKQKIRDVAIYGMGEEGKVLYWLLKKSGIKIKFVTDQRYDEVVVEDALVVSPGCIADHIDNVDLIIVSSDYYYDEIKKKLKDIGDFPTISAKELFERVLMCVEYGS